MGLRIGHPSALCAEQNRFGCTEWAHDVQCTRLKRSEMTPATYHSNSLAPSRRNSKLAAEPMPGTKTNPRSPLAVCTARAPFKCPIQIVQRQHNHGGEHVHALSTERPSCDTSGKLAHAQRTDAANTRSSMRTRCAKYMLRSWRMKVAQQARPLVRQQFHARARCCPPSPEAGPVRHASTRHVRTKKKTPLEKSECYIATWRGYTRAVAILLIAIVYTQYTRRLVSQRRRPATSVGRCAAVLWDGVPCSAGGPVRGRWRD